MVAHVFNLCIWEAKAGSLSLKPVWSIKQVLGQPGQLHKETLLRNGEKKFNESLYTAFNGLMFSSASSHFTLNQLFTHTILLSLHLLQCTEVTWQSGGSPDLTAWLQPQTWD